MRFLVFAFLLALMVSMIGADSSEEKHSHKDSHHKRHRRYLSLEDSPISSHPQYKSQSQEYLYP
uniref:Uncharacterized protein n=1 Tax=Sciurus vulgaris TaxID=55149 RepID=A0A8D2DRM6_SCIVU